MTDTKTNREIVQEGLNRRAEARYDADQEAQDALFLAELNKLTEASRNMNARREAAQRLDREQREAKRLEEATAARRDSFMQRTFITLGIIAAAILLHNIGAVAIWLALTISLSGLLYIIVNTWDYYALDNRKEN